MGSTDTRHLTASKPSSKPRIWPASSSRRTTASLRNTLHTLHFATGDRCIVCLHFFNHISLRHLSYTKVINYQPWTSSFTVGCKVDAQQLQMSCPWQRHCPASDNYKRNSYTLCMERAYDTPFPPSPSTPNIGSIIQMGWFFRAL